MLRFMLTLLLSLSVLWIVACSSNPQKSASTALPPDMLQKLKNIPLKARLSIPVQQVEARQLTNTWAAARSHGRRHEGIDIMAPRGTKVFSATDGLIADLRNNNLGGTVVWVIGPAGSWHYYAHLERHKRGLKVGDYVKKGQVLGYVGNSGNARHTAPHLHYGLYLDGKGRGVVNPYPYLR